MIYLIGGSPRGGKTILAEKLSKTTKTPYISTDYLKLMLRPYFTGAKKEKMFPFDKIWKKLTREKFFQTHTGKDMLYMDTYEAKIIWPGVKLFITHLAKGKIDYIVEGVHLLPKYVKYFKDNPNIEMIFLAKNDEKEIYKGLFKNRGRKDWIMDKLKNKNIVKLVAKNLSTYGPYFEKETKKYKLKLINTEKDFTKQINKAIKILTK